MPQRSESVDASIGTIIEVGEQASGVEAGPGIAVEAVRK